MTESVVNRARGALSRYDTTGRQLDWRTRQEIERIEQEKAVVRAAVEAAEDQEAFAIEQAVANGEVLVQQALGSLERINRRVREMSLHDRDLEYAGREIAQVFALAAGQQLGRYMTKRRI